MANLSSFDDGNNHGPWSSLNHRVKAGPSQELGRGSSRYRTGGRFDFNRDGCGFSLGTAFGLCRDRSGFGLGGTSSLAGRFRD